MKKLLLIYIVANILSCGSKHEKYKLEEISINNTGLKSLKNNLEYNNRMKLLLINNEFHIYNLGKNNILYDINLSEGNFTSSILNISVPSVAVNYEADTISVVTKDSFFKYTTKGVLLDKYCVTMPGQNFVIHPMYFEALHKFNNFYYYQIGHSQNYNYVDSSILFFFNKDTAFKVFNYPEEYSSSYIHYNEVCVASSSDDFFIVPTLVSSILKANISTGNEVRNKIQNIEFKRFDTTKLNDVLYISKYTEETRYIVKVLASKKHIFIIQRNPKSSSKAFTHTIHIYTHDLKRIDELLIEIPINENLTEVINDQLILVNDLKTKVYKYNFQ